MRPLSRAVGPLGARGNALTANPTTSELAPSLGEFQGGTGGAIVIQEERNQRDDAQQIMTWTAEGSISAKLAAGLPLTPAERLLAVTPLGLPVSKDAA
jgi:hypothetical protein